jgi:hypothetical protein
VPGALDLIKRHADARLTLPARPARRYPRTRGLLGDWAPLVFNDTGKGGRRVVRAVYEICTFQALRGGSQGTAETGNRMILMGEGAWSGPLLGL